MFGRHCTTGCELKKALDVQLLIGDGFTPYKAILQGKSNQTIVLPLTRESRFDVSP
jgi:hypothetical protein